MANGFDSFDIDIKIIMKVNVSFNRFELVSLNKPGIFIIGNLNKPIFLQQVNK